MSKVCRSEKERAICYCDTDFCNGDFHNILYKWITTSVENKTLFECVKEHIFKKESIPTPEPPEVSTLRPISILPLISTKGLIG
ncbi:hypothetical protein Aduo_011543 [Ancylostoma duodenale]